MTSEDKKWRLGPKKRNNKPQKVLSRVAFSNPSRSLKLNNVWFGHEATVLHMTVLEPWGDRQERHPPRLLPPIEVSRPRRTSQDQGGH
ncbi:hypothetical protein ACHAPI_008754 [Fusarium lateritium]